MNIAPHKSNEAIIRFTARIRQRIKKKKVLLELKRPKKKVKVANKEFIYRTIAELNKKIKRHFATTDMLTTREVKAISRFARRNPMRYIVSSKGALRRQDIREPLMTSKFAGSRINLRRLAKDATSEGREGNITIASRGVPSNIAVNVNIEVKYAYMFSPPNQVDMGSENIIGLITPQDINDEYLARKLASLLTKGEIEFKPENIVITDYTILSKFSTQEFLVAGGDTLAEQELQEARPLDITHLFNTAIDRNITYGCCREYVKDLWSWGDKQGKKKYKYNIDHLKTTKDFYDFCKSKNIKMLAYDINGRIIKHIAYDGKITLMSNYPNGRSPAKALLYIQYEQHIYPFIHKHLSKNTKLIKDNELKGHIVLDEKQVHYEYLRLRLDEEEAVKDIRIDVGKVKSFVYKNILYHSNFAYEKVKAFADVKGFSKKINYYTNFVSLSDILSEIYLAGTEMKSFMPSSNIYVKGGFNYFNKNYAYSDEDTMCIDMVKSYTTMLSDLEYCIKMDIRKCKINRDPKQELVGHYLYYVSVPLHTNLMPNTNLYYGELVIVARKYGIPFTIEYSYECMKTVSNPFKQLIYDTRNNLENKDSKLVINALIGKMERLSGKKYKRYIDKVGNKDEVKGGATDEHYIAKLKHNFKDKRGFIIDDEINAFYSMPKPNRKHKKYSTDFKSVINKEGFYIENPQSKKNRKRYKKDMKKWYKKEIWYSQAKVDKPTINQFTLKPIAIQIKDLCRLEIFRMSQELGLTPDEIKYAQTDSIAFRRTPEREEMMKHFLSGNLGGWRYEKLDTEDHSQHTVKNRCRIDYECNNKDNVLYLYNAGGGKTYLCIHTILPRLFEEQKTYVVLSTQHTALTPYRNKGINSNTIAHYLHRNKIPDEEVIVIDEIGMVGQKELTWIHRLFVMGKTIIGLGDYRQLLPVMKFSCDYVDKKSKEYKDATNSAYDGEKWLRLLFNKVIISKVNWRNNYTPRYYNSLCNGNKRYLLQQIKKECGVNYKDATLIITYMNATRHTFNKLKLDHLNIPYNIYKKGEVVGDKWKNTLGHSITYFDADNLQVGTWVMCKTNKFRKLDIYNKSLFRIDDVSENKITLLHTDASNNVLNNKERIIISKDDFLGKSGENDGGAFGFAYARTIYSIQGASIENGIHFALQDAKFLDGRTTYTVISRNKVELTQETIERNKKEIQRNKPVNIITPLPQKKRKVKIDNDFFEKIHHQALMKEIRMGNTKLSKGVRNIARVIRRNAWITATNSKQNKFKLKKTLRKF